MIEKLCLIGVGLIGGSLALSLRKSGYCKHVVGVGRNQQNLQDALDLNLIDEASQDVVEAVKGADMVVLATPVGTIQALMEQIHEHLERGAVVTDAGSVKQDVIAQVERACGYIPEYFVPGHPIAGNENSGAKASIDDLYLDRRVILTPLQNTDEMALEKVAAMWRETGALVESMTPEHHDRVLAATSHLPHLLAFGLVDSLARKDESEEIFRYAAGGFRDFTRIASSDPVMWRDICLHNRDAIIEALKDYEFDLAELRQAIEKGDGESVATIFSRAKQARDAFLL